MSNFDEAIKQTFKHEGGYNDVKGDAGGATNYGISLRFLKDYGELNDMADINGDGKIDAIDIKNITENQAKKIYYEEFWIKNKCHLIENDVVAAKLFDMAVNMGSKQAIKLLQKAINLMGNNLTVDGLIGKITVSLANQLQGPVLVTLMQYECIMFYLDLIKKKPDYIKFLKGWLNRAVS